MHPLFSFEPHIHCPATLVYSIVSCASGCVVVLSLTLSLSLSLFPLFLVSVILGDHLWVYLGMLVLEGVGLCLCPCGVFAKK